MSLLNADRRAAVLAVVVVCGLCSQTIAQTSYGRMDFRWRERGLGLLPTVNGAQTTVLPGGATGFVGADLNAVSSPSNAGDARFSLILEARVVAAPGVDDLAGIWGFGGSVLSTDLRSQGTFAATLSAGPMPQMRNAAAASTAVATIAQPLGPGAILPPGAPPSPASDRGVFRPFRNLLEGSPQLGGLQNLSTSGPRAQRATMENILVSATQSFLGFVDEETGVPGPYYSRYDVFGVDNWVPVIAVVYNIADVTTPRTISISFDVPATGLSVLRHGPAGGGPIPNGNGGLGWFVDRGDLPTFEIVVPAPGAWLAVFGVGAGLAVRRKRSAIVG